MKLYDYAISGSCYKVRLLLDFLNLEYESQQIDFYPTKEHKGPDFLDINPLGQLPVLDDEGVVIWDAQAILCHLANKYDQSNQWLPNDPQYFGQVMMWLAFAGDTLMASSEARLHDMLGYDLDIEDARKRTYEALRVLDDHLVLRQVDNKKWIVGDSPTIADIACFPYSALSVQGGVGHEDFPALRNWMRDFRRLHNFKAMPGIQEFV